MDIVSQGSVAVILLLRTSALWHHNIYIIISLGIPALGISAIGFSWSLIIYIPGRITMLYSLVTVIFDTMVIIATLYQCRGWLRRWKEPRSESLLSLTLKNGLVYYMLLLYANQPSIKELIGVGNYITRSISVNILSRFLLDIQETVQPKYSQCPPTLVSSSTQLFSMTPIASPNPNPLGPNGGSVWHPENGNRRR
ncbi:hypothetical protein BU17DRAFT_64006 [Hysterangium stoloniferum]|nr:hypothetical protein BU17DRAFT_64006 [Hysterangium stoloniferum]